MVRSWYQSVLSNEGNVSCSRKLKEVLMRLKLMTDDYNSDTLPIASHSHSHCRYIPSSAATLSIPNIKRKTNMLAFKHMPVSLYVIRNSDLKKINVSHNSSLKWELVCSTHYIIIKVKQSKLMQNVDLQSAFSLS